MRPKHLATLLKLLASAESDSELNFDNNKNVLLYNYCNKDDVQRTYTFTFNSVGTIAYIRVEKWFANKPSYTRFYYRQDWT
jgi:hypothetical protein